jgi:hypothetical protein
MGFSMMPLMTGAMQTLRSAAVAKASTTLNIIQQAGSSIGTAVMVVILTAAIKDKVPAGALQAQGAVAADPSKASDPSVAAGLREAVVRTAEAFGHTFWWATGLVVLAFLVAVIVLPKRKPPVSDEDAAEVPAHMMMG